MAYLFDHSGGDAIQVASDWPPVRQWHVKKAHLEGDRVVIDEWWGDEPFVIGKAE